MANSELLEQSLATLQRQMERRRKILHTFVEGRPEMAETDCGGRKRSRVAGQG